MSGATAWRPPRSRVGASNLVLNADRHPGPIVGFRWTFEEFRKKPWKTSDRPASNGHYEWTMLEAGQSLGGGGMTIGHLVAPRPRGPRDEPGLMRSSDDQLLEMFIERGDHAAFTALVERHSSRVLGVCRQILHRSHDIEDTFQATFLLLARKAATIRERTSLGNWLHGVAHRLAVRAKVKASRSDPNVDGRRGVALEARSSEDEMDHGELRRIIHEEVDQLPERLRQPILLCYLEGLTNEDAARLLGCPPSTLKERLSKARDILHGRLSRRGLAWSAALFILLLPRTSEATDVPRRLIESTVAAVMATVGRRASSNATGTTAPGAGSGSEGGRSSTRLAFLTLAATAIGSVAVAILYLTSPERDGFFSWLQNTVRRACH